MNVNVCVKRTRCKFKIKLMTGEFRASEDFKLTYITPVCISHKSVSFMISNFANIPHAYIR